MIMEPSITRTEQFSGALKSFLQQLRAMVGKPDASSSDAERFKRDWDAFLGEALQHTTPLSQEACERRAAITQVIQSADGSTKTSIADLLLFADDLDQAHDAIMMQRKAA